MFLRSLTCLPARRPRLCIVSGGSGSSDGFGEFGEFGGFDP